MVKKTVNNESKYLDFYQNLRQKLNNWMQAGKLTERTGKWTDRFLQYLLVFPDMVHLMIKLFFDKEIPSIIKGYILMGLVYILSPIDVVPDFIPVAGFIDDLLVATVILNKIINTNNVDIKNKINYFWSGEEDIFTKVKEITVLINNLSAEIPKALWNFMGKK